MFKTRFTTSAILIALLAGITTATAQDPPRSGIYQIQSGIYREVGGLFGAYTLPLPASSSAFVALEIDPGAGATTLTFLGRNQQAVFRRLTNGIVSGDTIQFHYQTALPFPPRPGQVDYVVTNAAGHLWISGSITSTPMCCDIPYLFEHQDVKATFLPVLSIHAVGEVELRWTSASNQNYQVQYQSDLTQLVWTNLGGTVHGNGTTNDVVESATPVHSQRFYRILTWP